MEAWQEKRSVHTMNLRSVFTSEQQRILERYYENGMINQSKSCFQLILQCAQEAKLDFSVVRTWVGNKRRKLASKVDKNGVVGLSTHAIVGSGAALVAGPVLAGAQRGLGVAHLLPPPSSCPSSSSSSSSSSPSSNGANNNDVIVTGSYSLLRNPARQDASSQSRSSASTSSSASSSASPSLPPKVLLLNPDPESGLHSRLILHPDVASLQRKSPQIPVSSALMFNQIRGALSPRDLPTVPPSWAKQYGPPQHQPFPGTSHKPASANQHRTPAESPAETGVRIQQVFTIAGLTDALQRTQSGPVRDQRRTPFETPETFSIAMETGDADEYSREEELANMGAQLHLSKSGGNEGYTTLTESSLIDQQGAYIRITPPVAHNTPNSGSVGEKGCQTSRLRVEEASNESCAVKALSESSPSGPTNHKESITAAPWLVSNSRKRTLQDRTQFSDGDLFTLKRYWDNGMTSLGSVCREKIIAASNELSVDVEIVKTWIGNRRRKYRLMGIEIPPPKGGPATFPKITGAEPPPSSTPERDGPKTSEAARDGEENDSLSICLSEDGESDSNLKENDVHDGANSSAHDENVKIEIIDEDEDDDDDIMITTDLEQMHNLIEYKHEEVQYLESELVRQKQKYHELRTFTRNLLIALKNDDKEKQQELLSTLPHPMEEDLTEIPEQEEECNTELNSRQKDSSVSEGEGAAEPMGP